MYILWKTPGEEDDPADFYGPVSSLPDFVIDICQSLMQAKKAAITLFNAREKPEHVAAWSLAWEKTDKQWVGMITYYFIDKSRPNFQKCAYCISEHECNP